MEFMNEGLICMWRRNVVVARSHLPCSVLLVASLVTILRRFYRVEVGARSQSLAT